MDHHLSDTAQYHRQRGDQGVQAQSYQCAALLQDVIDGGCQRLESGQHPSGECVDCVQDNLGDRADIGEDQIHKAYNGTCHALQADDNELNHSESGHSHGLQQTDGNLDDRVQKDADQRQQQVEGGCDEGSGGGGGYLQYYGRNIGETLRKLCCQATD